MEARTFVLLLLPGLCNLRRASTPYYFMNVSTTWPNARQLCRQGGGDLATVNDPQDLQELAGVMETSGHVALVGLRRQWAWSAADADDYREGEPAYWNWTDANETSGGACGAIGLSGKWFSSNCSSRSPFFCYRARSANSPRSFYLEERAMNWSDARAFCRSTYTDLAWVQNHHENQALQGLSRNRTVWIGLSWTSWRWSDGSEATFVPWKTPLLSYGDCGALDVRQQTPGIVQTNCFGTAPFLCSRDPRRERWLRLRLRAEDPFIKDPEASKSLLELIEMKLSKVGLTKDVKLSWLKHPEKEDEMEQTTQEEKMCLFNDSYVHFS